VCPWQGVTGYSPLGVAGCPGLCRGESVPLAMSNWGVPKAPYKQRFFVEGFDLERKRRWVALTNAYTLDEAGNAMWSRHWELLSRVDVYPLGAPNGS